MEIPEKLEIGTNAALKIVRENSIHHFPAFYRKSLIDVFFEIGTARAEIARKRLAILSAQHVIHFYVPPNCEKYSKEFHDEEGLEWSKEYQADYALELAEKVLQGGASAEDAYHLACNAHYSTGVCMPLRSMLADIAANRALVEVTAPNPQWLYSAGIKGDKLDKVQAIGHFEAAPSAAIAIACEIDASLVDENLFPDNWNWWINDTPVNPQKMLAFWEWYLLIAVPQAWELSTS